MIYKIKRKPNVPLWTGDLRVDDSARWRVGKLVADHGEKPAVDALLDHHHAQLGATSEWKGLQK